MSAPCPPCVRADTFIGRCAAEPGHVRSRRSKVEGSDFAALRMLRCFAFLHGVRAEGPKAASQRRTHTPPARCCGSSLNRPTAMVMVYLTHIEQSRPFRACSG